MELPNPMLDKLRQFISDIASAGSAPRPMFGDGDYRLAAAALLIHVISLDGAPSEVELKKLKSLLEFRFDLEPEAADHLIAEATLAEGGAVDLFHFTSVLMHSLDEGGRLRIVEMMWELVYADDHVTEFEENVVWRAADLLGISGRDRVNLRNLIGAGRLPDAKV
jgi:uncharacterized tellurite resistance protein B-like protein